MKKRVCVQRSEKEKIELLKRWRRHPDWNVEEAVRELGKLDQVVGSDHKRKKDGGRKRRSKPYEYRVVEYFDNLRENEWSFDDLLFYCRSLDDFKREFTNPRSQISWVRRFLKCYGVDNSNHHSRSQTPKDNISVEQAHSSPKNPDHSQDGFDNGGGSDDDVASDSGDSLFEAESSPDKPPPLSRKPVLRKRTQPDSMLLKWSREDDDKELFVFPENVDSLRPLQRLTATVIDYFIQRYMIRVPGLVYTCGSTIFRSIEAGHAGKHDKETRYDSLRGIFDWKSYPYILLPICTVDHWSSVVVENALREGPTGFFVVTSKKGVPDSLVIFKPIKSFLFNERYVRTNVSASCEWRYGVFKTKPQQRNEVDCGIYLLYYMDDVSRKLAEQELMPGLNVKDKIAQWTAGGFNTPQVEDRRASMLKRLLDDIKNEDFVESATV